MITQFAYEGKTKKGKEIVVRYPAMSDLVEMTNYFNTLSKEQTYIMFQGEQLTLKYEKKYLTDFLKKVNKGEAIKLFAFHNDKLVGVSDIVMQERAANHVGTFGLTVAENYRGEGIGKLLMNLVIQEAKKRIPKLKIIQLGVFGNNGIACSLYEKLGFTRFGILPKGIYHQDHYVDHIYMYKNV